MKLRFLAMSLIFIVGFMSCKSSKTSGKETREVGNKKTNFIVSQIQKNESTYPKSLSFKAATELVTHDKTTTFKASVRMVTDSVIWMSITAYSYEVARILATPDSVKYFSRTDKKYYIGNYDFIEKKMGVQFDFFDLQSLILAHSFGLDEIEKIRRSNSKRSYVLSSIRKGKLKKMEKRGVFDDEFEIVYTNWVNPETYKVERVETSGIGDMAKAFAELKVKLEAMGYFSPDKKQALPANISSLAIVTSKTSAAVTDVLNVIKRRNPLLDVHIYHASVQGERAVEGIIDALLNADINQHDVVLLTRGGGSQEDLWTFNDVSIAQTLFNLSTPCVSAIGHERDTSITDLVADISAITPTAAAELLTPDLANLKLKLQHNLKTIQRFINNKLSNNTQLLDIAYHKLEKSHPKNAMAQEKQRITARFEKMSQLMESTFNNQKNQLAIQTNNLKRFDFQFNRKISELDIKLNNMKNLISLKIEQGLNSVQNLSNRLNTLSPLSTLSRGYSITLKHNNKSVIKNSNQVAIGDELETIVSSGKIKSKVTHVEPR